MNTPSTLDEFEHHACTNIAYHEESEQHFARLLRWSQFGSVTLSSGALISALDVFTKTGLVTPENGPLLTAGLAIAVALLNAATLALDWSSNARTHALLKVHWSSYLARAHERGTEDCQRIAGEFWQLNAMEPPPDMKRLQVVADRTTEIFDRYAAEAEGIAPVQ